jgi:predicted membrane protein
MPFQNEVYKEICDYLIHISWYWFYILSVCSVFQRDLCLSFYKIIFVLKSILLIIYLLLWLITSVVFILQTMKPVIGPCLEPFESKPEALHTNFMH